MKRLYNKKKSAIKLLPDKLYELLQICVFSKYFKCIKFTLGFHEDYQEFWVRENTFTCRKS